MLGGSAQLAMPGSTYSTLIQSDNHFNEQSQQRGLAPKALKFERCDYLVIEFITYEYIIQKIKYLLQINVLSLS